jgi:hypothetical protein
MPAYSTPSAVQALACHKCGVIDVPAIAPGNGPHAFREQCRHCAQFLQWLSRYPPTERDAQRQQARQQAMTLRPPSARQLAYLQSLRDDGPVPTTMAEASARIDVLVHREVV